MRPIDVVRKVAPTSKLSYYKAFDAGDPLFKQHGITTPLRLAHFLAQVMHETGGLRIEYESGKYSANRLMQIFGVGVHSAKVTHAEAEQLAMNEKAIFERVYGVGNPKKAKEFDNTRPGDGFRYRGTGLMQTTGRSNYRRMGKLCGVDFENHPELILSETHALKPALAEWTAGNLNAAADRDDIRAITKRINGGYNGLADRQAWFRKIYPLIDKVDLKSEPITTSKNVDDAAKSTGTVVVATAAGYGIWQWLGEWGLAAFGAAVTAALIGYGIYKYKNRTKIEDATGKTNELVKEVKVKRRVSKKDPDKKAKGRSKATGGNVTKRRTRVPKKNMEQD